ncbi:carbon catabolite repressor protein 4 homolog 4 isoform X2 [Impatiens glandulifera]|nr:carbon catabolite repressor protein 4 homolog 4 isoform X2 [Impatiens glandulifera]
MSTTVEPLCPKFVPVEHSKISNTTEGLKFRLVSYNVLAQAYAKSEQFPHSPSPCRKWKTRSMAILSLLKSLGTDFLCLQEVDEYNSFYKANLESNGYASIYVQRSGKKPDGCGIFYKKTSAELIIEEKIEFNDLVDSVQNGASSQNDEVPNENKVAQQSKKGLLEQNTSGDRGDPNDPRVRLKRDCVGIMAAFRFNKSIIIVANTHIYWDPEWADVKLAQAKYLVFRLYKFKERISNEFNCAPPVIVAGDFNSTPGDKVYEFMTEGSLLFDDQSTIPLSSAYAVTMGEPQFTNYTPGFTGTLDYIFFSASAFIRPIGYLQIPESESPDIEGGLPNYHHPSDHLPIGAEFELIND